MRWLVGALAARPDAHVPKSCNVIFLVNSWLENSLEISVFRNQYKRTMCVRTCMRTLGPHREETCLLDFRHSEPQTSLLSYRD